MFAEWAHERKLSRMRSSRGFYRFLALDHGLSFGPIEGIEDLALAVRKGVDSGFAAVVVTLGMLRWLPPSQNCAIIVQAFGAPTTTNPPIPKLPLAEFDDFLRAAPDAIAVQIDPFNSPGIQMMPVVGKMIQSALAYGIPTLLMVNVPNIQEYSMDRLRSAIRIAGELGASLVKTPLPSGYSEDDIRRLNDISRFSPPMLLAGGGYRSDFSINLAVSRKMGFSGVCLGRNYFQAPNADQIAELLKVTYP